MENKSTQQGGTSMNENREEGRESSSSQGGSQSSHFGQESRENRGNR